ncbi:alpha/beta fold hydrolase [Rhodococcus sp. D2-41]|nr:alpha/beta fold hydrolase [Rhodococcus sp. D2-41]
MSRSRSLAEARARSERRLLDRLLRSPADDPERIPVSGADGCPINVEARGPADGPLVVLSHGWTCSTEVWHAQVNDLARDHRVITYDQRGHGRTPTGAMPLDANTLADDLAAVLQATVPRGRRAVIAGHSMGGMTVIAWAGRHSGQVRRYAGAVLLASTATDRLIADVGVVPVPEGLPWATERIGHAALTARVSAALLPQWGFRYVAVGPDATPAQAEFCRKVVNSCSARNRALWGAAIAGLDIRAALHGLTVPTSVLVGQADRLTPPVHARRIAQVLAETGHLERLLELPRVGHMSQVESPRAFTAELRRLAVLSARSTTAAGRRHA